MDCHHLVVLHLQTLFRVLITALGLSSQTHPMARHMLLAITSYRKGIPVCIHVLPGRFVGSCIRVDPCLFFSSFEAEKTKHIFGLPPLILSENCMVEDPFVHQSSTLDLPGDVLTLVCQNIFPRSFVRRLHSFFNGVTRFSFPIHSISQDLEMHFKGNSVTPRHGVS